MESWRHLIHDAVSFLIPPTLVIKAVSHLSVALVLWLQMKQDGGQRTHRAYFWFAFATALIWVYLALPWESEPVLLVLIIASIAACFYVLWAFTTRYVFVRRRHQRER
jgi:hypothetical protein